MRCEQEPGLRFTGRRKAPENVGPVGQNVFEPCFRAARTQEIGNELRALAFAGVCCLCIAVGIDAGDAN